MPSISWVDALLLILGFCAWYFLYGVECFLNGAMGGWELPYKEAWRELLWNLPVLGKKFRLADTRGDEDWAAQLPGPIHFVCMCVLLPLGPWLIYRAIHQLGG